MPDLTAQLPAALRRTARWERLGERDVPAMLVHPDWDAGDAVPLVIWMHGRTVNKELGDRFEAALQQPERGGTAFIIDMPPLASGRAGAGASGDSAASELD